LPVASEGIGKRLATDNWQLTTSPMDAAIFGLIVADLIAEPMDLRSPPAPGGLVITNSIRLTTGGNVCNTGVAMAKLGAKVAAAGLVGRDVLGTAVTEKLKAEGLDTSAVFPSDRDQTSASVVAVEPTGERCFFHTPGVTKLLDADAFRRCLRCSSSANTSRSATSVCSPRSPPSCRKC
jgi:sugar/nucleoside kinase (ribokinase family)